MRNTFRHGIHPIGNKEQSKDVPISVMPVPNMLYVPLAQQIGGLPEIVVKEGEAVKKGQLLAKASKLVSANIFSPVSGTVKGFPKRPFLSGQTGVHIQIENDFLEEEVTLPKLDNPDADAILKRVADAGIVGMGGAAFPAHVKLTVPKDKTVDTLVINGAECEPYLTSDYRIMLELTDEFFAGVKLLARALNVQNIAIGVEDNKPEAIAKLESAAKGVRVVPLHTKYPQGAEKQLIYSVTGRAVPLGGLPADAHVVVQNVHTALSVYRACALGIPCYERIVTVSGKAIAEPKNMWVRTGTTVEDVANACGGVSESVKKVLNGGPMMGVSQITLNGAVTKSSGGLLFLTEEEINTEPAMACINCGRCGKVCPMQLMPMFIDGYTLVGEYGVAKRYGALACIECGCCAYICPAKRPLVQSIRLSKKMIKERNI